MSARTSYFSDGAREIYTAANQAGQATSTGLSTTQTGFTLTNPAESGKTLVILQIRAAFTSAPAAAATLVLTANVNPVAAAVTQTTPLVVRPANMGVTKSGVGLAASAVTLPIAPVVIRPLGGPVATGSVSQMQVVDDLEGSIAVAPGCAVSINSLTTAISAIFSVTWEEVAQFA